VKLGLSLEERQSLLRESTVKTEPVQLDERFENVSLDRINTLRSKKTVIAKANDETLQMNEEVWSFVTSNQVDEIFSYLLKS
jgi:hypothetical protein